ncbi:LysR substrate-binding domain-containing protein [Tropicibacter sp. Alg240-R139]|uniref:LysR substrate-binding domain-containing protein n=1 Tax=Tropicibacter sp. Alg240-R139 TaxID=2305991 RepID=UPI0013DEF436|nr:LysR substrate-binding domain-containing protein [Tropicibacter sp. Alg240-R139]
MSRLPPLNALRAFDAAGRHLNFRLAAEELGVTQGAVAQQVRGLEARLGVQLFDRVARGLELTRTGRVYLAPVNRAFALLEEATEGVGAQSRTLTISVTPSFASKWLVSRLGRLTELHPDLDVRVDARPGLSNFQSDGIDIAVRQGTPPFGPGLVAEPLFAASFIAVCSPSLSDLAVPEDLKRHTLLHDSHGLWPLYLEQLGLSPGPRAISFNQTSLAIDAAVAGQGVALADAPLVADEIERGRLRQVFEAGLSADLGFYIVAPRRPRVPEPVKLMREWLLSEAVRR